MEYLLEAAEIFSKIPNNTILEAKSYSNRIEIALNIGHLSEVLNCLLLLNGNFACLLIISTFILWLLFY
jgi:hypothetical protein